VLSTDIAVYPINAIGQHPFIGRGISRRTANAEYSEFYGYYGIIDIPARFGIIMGSIYFILFYILLEYRLLCLIIKINDYMP